MVTDKLKLDSSLYWLQTNQHVSRIMPCPNCGKQPSSYRIDEDDEDDYNVIYQCRLCEIRFKLKYIIIDNESHCVGITLYDT